MVYSVKTPPRVLNRKESGQVSPPRAKREYRQARRSTLAKARSPQQPVAATGLSHFILPFSVEEGHVPHGLRLSLGVHHDLVPAVQGDGSVVCVPDPTLDVDAGVAPHRAPAPTLRLRAARQDALVLRLGDAVGVPGADVDC